MVRLCIIEKEKKKINLFKKNFYKLVYYKDIINSYYFYNAQKHFALGRLQKIPRNSHITRIQNRCYLTGRARGYFKRFGLSRHKVRELALNGDIPGMTKSSW